jgi:hypothetical protein
VLRQRVGLDEHTGRSHRGCYSAGCGAAVWRFGSGRRRTIVRVHGDYRAAMQGWRTVAVAPIRTALERLTPSARAHFMEGWRLLHEEAATRASGQSDVGACQP